MTVQLWLEQYPPEEGAEDILEFQPPPALFQDEVEPAYFTMNTFFAYVYGPSFVEFLYEDGGWTRVNRAYGFQPDTTEQILHPEKYQQGDPPIFLSHPDLTSVFGGDWELIRRDSLGEWASYLLLAYNDFPEARRLEDEAQAAAAGWGDDQYWVYYDPTNNDVFLSVYWIWETTEDADEFFDSLLASTSARFGTNEVEGPGESGRCFSLTQQVSCIYQNQEHVLWLYSDNAETLEAAKEKFTKFP
ncbi:MAG: hypothetical protein GWN30_11515 [Gammaproteobacteria bacterium]|nr:hypothetical protein [Gammaproteobacteria bacterium]